MRKEQEKDIYGDASLLNNMFAGAYSKEQEDQILKKRPELKEAYERIFLSGQTRDTFDKYGRYSSQKAFLRFKSRTKLRKIRIYTVWTSVAAVALLVLTIAGYWFKGRSSSAGEEYLIGPGEEKAVLSFGKGETSVDVNDSASVDTIIDHIKISSQGGVLSYRPVHGYVYTPSVSASYTLKLNKLITPLGTEHRVVLSDGTSVRLNAGSKLVYPIRFCSDKRIVYLEGEGYFDVAKDAEHPFVVNTQYGSIQVLGTSFNVNAYSGGTGCYTTLVQGVVQCTTTTGKVEKLAPNEQLAMDESGNAAKFEVNIDEYVGWTRGLYIFKNRTLKEIMDTFERWYNVKVTYANPEIATWKYSGTVKRNESINAFLHALELTGEIYFKIQGQYIEIYEK